MLNLFKFCISSLTLGPYQNLYLHFFHHYHFFDQTHLISEIISQSEVTLCINTTAGY